ncbi:unnamed protein product [Brachionus calyciflorus]|uniref:G-protein coupled receptors family 1 profile domain-containing protein n=1 Tax=Brachionus calyciflorus TaxID=104777 RepID=A0A814G5U2_9BILA|nr:unnamed protein product [Brachionus calyciflorus]
MRHSKFLYFFINLFIIIKCSTNYNNDDENQSDDNIDFDNVYSWLDSSNTQILSNYASISSNSSSIIVSYNELKNSSRTLKFLSLCNQNKLRCIFLSLSLGLLIIFTIIGNTFVIAAVILDRNLHNVANYLILSLAFADLTVAIMVMPIGAYQEVFQEWSLGKLLCDIWTIFDVLCCTASILHLVAIALDRYWAITKFGYAAIRTSKRIFSIIAIIWTVSLIVAITPHIFGLSYDVNNTERCHLTDNLTYQLVSTVAAFYLPLIGMCIIYWKIFRTAKLRIRKKAFKNQSLLSKFKTESSKLETKEIPVDFDDENKLKINNKNYSVYSFEKTSNNLRKNTLLNKTNLNDDLNNKDTSLYDIKNGFVSADYDGLNSSLEYMSLNQVDVNLEENIKENRLINKEENVNKNVLLNEMKAENSPKKLQRPEVSNILKKRAEIDMKRERKAAKTLGVIMSCFIICWLPYFLMQIFFAMCKNCYVTRLLENSLIVTFLTWSGYLNSMLNPVIYTIFSPDFRSAFTKILCGKYRSNFK